MSPRHHSRRDQTPIALLPHRPPAAPLSHLPPDAISCLGAFQTPVAERMVRSSLPASENLHSSRHSPRDNFASCHMVLLQTGIGDLQCAVKPPSTGRPTPIT